MKGCPIAVKCATECRLKRSAICYVIGEGGAGCGALLRKPEMSCVNFRRLGKLFSVNGFLNVPLLILVMRHKDRKYSTKLWFMILANIQLHLWFSYRNSTLCNLNEL